MNGLIQECRVALRSLAHARGFTVVAILTLALGVGANAAIFSVIRGVLLRPPPFADADRAVLLTETRPGTPGYSGAISAPNYLDWAEQNTIFEHIAAITGGGVTLRGRHGQSIYVDGRIVSASYFDVFGVRAALGRTFEPDEGQPERARVVVLSHRLWASHFGSDPAAVNSVIQLDGEDSTVIGVMPADFSVDLLDPELWQPGDLGHQGGPLTVGGATRRDRHDLMLAAAKLKAGVSLDQAQAQMTGIADRLAFAFPESNKGWGVMVQRWPRPVGRDFEQSVYLLAAAVGMLLLIGCVNLANLVLARDSSRTRDIAIRAVLGAGRGRLVRELLTEHIVLGAAGALCGLAVGYAILAIVADAIPLTGILKAVPSETKIAMDPAAWLFTLGLSALSVITFGLIPAWRVTRLSLAEALRQLGGRSVAAGRVQRQTRRRLIIAEMALAFVLLMSAGLLTQSLFGLQRRVAAGFDSTNVLTARVPIPSSRFTNSKALNAYVDRISEGIQSLPGVRDVAFAEAVPTQGTLFVRAFQVVGQPPSERANRPSSSFKTVSPSYFRAVGLRIREGRALNDGDRQGAPFALVVNETFARMYLPGVDPIGAHLLMRANGARENGEAGDVMWEVVGVVADEGISPWTRTSEAVMYAARNQNPSDDLALIVRTTIGADQLRESIRLAVWAVDRDQALTNIRSLDSLKADSAGSERLRSLLLGVFAGIAMVLAAIGLAGVMALAVTHRTREIGIRAALGATATSLIALVLREGMMMTVWGLAWGLVGTLLVQRLLRPFLIGVSASDPMTMTAVALILAAVGLISSYVPARQAAAVDPLVALRCE